MRYVQINVKTEYAHETVRALGKHGKLHVVDLSRPGSASAQHMALKKKLVRCDELLRQLGWFEEQMEGAGVEVPAVHLEVRAAADVLASAGEYFGPRQDQLEQHIRVRDGLAEEVARLRERRRVLEVAQDSLRHRVLEFDRREEELEMHDAMEMVEGGAAGGGGAGAGGGSAGSRFHQYVVGVLATGQQPLFERMVFRVTRGNALVSFVALDETTSVFYAVCVGRTVHERLTRLVRAVGARVHEVPDSTSGFHRERDQCTHELEERAEVLQRTEAEISRLLQEVASQPGQGRSPLREWQWALKREKGVLATLLRCHFYMTMAVLEGWCPAADLGRLRSLLRPQVSSGAVAISVEPDNTLAPRGAPPTHFETTKVTEPFNQLVSTYGVARYREINPALASMVTFPLCFGIMFGDVGHGSALFLTAVWLVWNERELRRRSVAGRLNELLSMLFSGRYMLVAMGFFAVYSGLVYNDCLSLPLQLFESRWRWDPVDDTDQGASQREGLAGQSTGDGVYPFGVDPAWYGSRNELAFMNSLKMKMSVVVGVCHMMLGLALGAANHLHFRDWPSLALEFVPQVLFLASTFGYMIALVLYKWCQAWPGGQAPSVLQTMIQFGLAPGHVSEHNQLYEGQAGVQLFLLAVAFLSVPVMLLGKPLLRRHRNSVPVARTSSGGSQSYARLSAESDGEGDDGDDGRGGVVDEDGGLRIGAGDEAGVRGVGLHDEDDEKAPLAPGGGGDDDDAGAPKEAPYDFGEDMILSSIHTIEFVLGSVSHTASYLRLWALSLAHAELSKVFWEKLVVEQGLEGGSGFGAAIAFAVWAGVTCMVLLGMDALECFLHALRLTWVEFQSKFYKADGYEFQPFSFREAVLSMGVDPDEMEQ